MPTLGKRPLKFINQRDFSRNRLFNFSDDHRKLMDGPVHISRFLDSGEAQRERVHGALVYHADLGVSKGSEELPSELVQYQTQGRNVRVLTEGEPGWVHQVQDPAFSKPEVWSKVHPITSRGNPRGGGREAPERRSLELRVPEEVVSRNLTQAANELNGIVHDRHGLPIDREARQVILDRHEFLAEQAIGMLKERS
eukprot:1111114-Alexandrium_andersonii.AAC.1